MPKRIQRKRSKDWRMPSNAVYVGRPTKWGNPYQLTQYRIEDGKGNLAAPDVQEKEQRACACRDFEAALGVGMLQISEFEIKCELRGKDLACWCPLDKECHADTLLEIANG